MKDMKTKAVRKAVIPVAGLGTRFLPATKAIPKEMLPIVDKPGILYIVEEAKQAGIEEIIFITGRHKTALEEFFDHAYEIEDFLQKNKKSELLEKTRAVSQMVQVISVRQKQPLGLGHAVHCARSVVGDEPFAVLLGDEIMRAKPEFKGGNVTQQLIDKFHQTGKSVIAIMEVAQTEVHKYGIADIDKAETDSKTHKIKNLVEKPKAEKAPSRWALPGRYVFTSDIFSALEKTKPSASGEIQLTDAMNVLAHDGHLLGHSFTADRFDVGDKLGFICANIEFALKHEQLGHDVRKYIVELAERIQGKNL